jgi:hypothetical protein
MKFFCLGYGNDQHWEAMARSEQEALIEECFDYDAQLLERGHWLDAGQCLQSARFAKVLRWKDGQVIVTDGPFAETKEQLGGTGLLEASGMQEAVELVSRHPGLRMGGSFEIRPIDENTYQRNLALQGQVAASDTPGPADSPTFASMGYISDAVWTGRSQADLDRTVQECMAFDEERRKEGQWLSGIALQIPATAKTVRLQGGSAVVTDGPYAETKEWLGGVVVLRLPDMEHAVDLLAGHPALRAGVFMEIRPIDQAMNARWESRRDRILER